MFEVFARASNGSIYRRPYDGTTWSNWAPLVGLVETTDARSDLDCVAFGMSTIHIVATGLNPVGALLHSIGAGTSYNQFKRELSGSVFDPSPSIYVGGETWIGALSGKWPALYLLGDQPSSIPQEVTPITNHDGPFRSGPDISVQPLGGSAVTYFAVVDETGALAIHAWVRNSGGARWADPITLSAPTGTFTLSPAICTEREYGIVSVNVAAVAGGKLWYARADSFGSQFSSWTMISENVASSPDCAIGGPESIAHIVALSSSGTVLDVYGKGTSWVTTDLGRPR